MLDVHDVVFSVWVDKSKALNLILYLPFKGLLYKDNKINHSTKYLLEDTFLLEFRFQPWSEHSCRF